MIQTRVRFQYYVHLSEGIRRLIRSRTTALVTHEDFEGLMDAIKKSAALGIPDGTVVELRNSYGDRIDSRSYENMIVGDVLVATIE